MNSFLPASVLSFLQGYLLHAGLFAGGALLVSVPIIIHLLNRRRFKTLDWAAMDLLLEAERQNRRRVQMEQLLLLLLRCLAVFLVACLVARPFLSSLHVGKLLNSPRFERIVVLDDSLSLHARGESGRTSFEAARKACGEFIRNLANNSTDDALTLVLSSRPDRRVMNQRPLNSESLPQILSEIESIAAADTVSNLNETLAELNKYLANGSDNVNRTVYLATDLRQIDWVESALPAQASLASLAQETAKNCQQFFLVDVAEKETANLAVVDIRPRDDRLVGGVETQFDVAIANYGPREARDVTITFSAASAAPRSTNIESIAVGATATASFSHVFSLDETELSAKRHFVKPVQVVVEAKCDLPDALPDDNQRRFAARVVPGVPVLLVDGDPSSQPEKAESYYLRHALNASGAARSGVVADVATESEFEAVSLSKYRVVVLCNLARISSTTNTTTTDADAREASASKAADAAAPLHGGRLGELEAWVREGGSLVVFPGDQVDESFYNSSLYQQGQGLLPAKLAGLAGDETEAKWSGFNVASAEHPAWGIFSGENNAFVNDVKVFRWWRLKTDENPVRSGAIRTPAFLRDEPPTPAWVEWRVGNGQVALAALPADADWHNWPESPTYLVACQSMIASLCRGDALLAQIATLQSLSTPLDLGEYRAEAELSHPDGANERLLAAPPAAEKRESPGQPPLPLGDSPSASPRPTLPGPAPGATWRMASDILSKQGFYSLKLHRHDGASEELLFAANAPASESQLIRIDRAELKRQLGGASVGIIEGENWPLVESRGAQQELWKPLLWALVALLGCEQLLAFWFARNR